MDEKIDIKEELSETTITTSTSSEDSSSLKSDAEKVEKKSDDVFCVPSIPAPKPPVAKQTQPQATLDYKAPEWSSQPPQPEDLNEESQLDAEGFCDHYFFEVIKNGSIVDKIKITKEFTTFGRLANCDVLCEHPSLSRFHAVLQYSAGVDEKFPRGLYLFDLGSTHGTYVNKTKLEPQKFTRVEVESVIKFGMSTRLYILHGPKPPIQATDEDLKINLTHDQMKKIKEKYDRISMKLRIRKEIAEEEEEANAKSSGGGIDWGMAENENEEMNAEDDPEGENPFAQDLNQADESYYSDDPRKALKAYFDRENDELEYEMDELGPGKFKCRIRLPILNDFGEYMYAESQGEGKKKECQAQCALEACRILNAHGVLKPRQGESAANKRRKQKNWKSDDYYDSDEDTFLDRTGEIEKKRQKRIEADSSTASSSASSSSNKTKIHTFDSIKEEIKRLITEKFEIETKLNKCKDVFKAVGNDDIDDYINSLKSCEIDTITRAKLKRRLAEITNELVKFEKLLVVAKPGDFDVAKWRADQESRIMQIVQHPHLQTQQQSVVPKPKPPPKQEIKEVETEIPSKVESTRKEPKSEAALVEKKSQVVDKKPETIIKSDKQSSETQLKSSGGEKQSKRSNEIDLTDKPYEDSLDYAVWMPPKDKRGNIDVIHLWDILSKTDLEVLIKLLCLICNNFVNKKIFKIKPATERPD